MIKRFSELKLWELKHLTHLFLCSLAALKEKCFEEAHYQMQFYLIKGTCVALPGRSGTMPPLFCLPVCLHAHSKIQPQKTASCRPLFSQV